MFAMLLPAFMKALESRVLACKALVHSTASPDPSNIGVGATCARQVFAMAYEILACLC